MPVFAEKLVYVYCRYNTGMRVYTTHYIADVTDDEETTVDEW